MKAAAIMETFRGLIENEDIIERMRSFVEDTSKLFYTDNGAGITINMWPWLISAVLFLVGKMSKVVVKNKVMQNADVLRSYICN